MRYGELVDGPTVKHVYVSKYTKRPVIENLMGPILAADFIFPFVKKLLRLTAPAKQQEPETQ